MARNKETHVYTIRIPLEDMRFLREYYGEGKALANAFRAIVKKLIAEKKKVN